MLQSLVTTPYVLDIEVKNQILYWNDEYESIGSIIPIFNNWNIRKQSIKNSDIPITSLRLTSSNESNFSDLSSGSELFNPIEFQGKKRVQDGLFFDDTRIHLTISNRRKVPGKIKNIGRISNISHTKENFIFSED